MPEMCRTKINFYRRKTCACPGNCTVCGFKRHSAIHLPPHGAPAGAKPWGHEYQSETDYTPALEAQAR